MTGAASFHDSDLARRVGAACLGTRVSQLQRLVGRRFDAALSPLGMSVQQMEILTALAAGDPQPVKPAQLARWLSTERSTMSRNLAALQSLGWVRPATMSASQRALSVELTDAGREVYRRAEPLWQQAQSDTLTDLGAHSVSTLDGWLRCLAPDAERHMT